MALGWLAWAPLDLLWHWAGSGARDAAALWVAGVAGVELGNVHLRFAGQAWHLVTSTFVLRGKRGAYCAGLGLVARSVAVSRP